MFVLLCTSRSDPSHPQHRLWWCEGATVMGTAIGGSSSRGLVDRSARSGSLNRVVELARGARLGSAGATMEFPMMIPHLVPI
jgi:hypothetical protein